MSALPPPDQKARSVRDMFDRIAPRYDLANRLLTGKRDQGWRRSLVERLGVTAGDHVLDLACGTGDFAEIAQEAGATVTGLDFARGMLRAARARGLQDISLVQGDALAMPFAGGTFSVAVSGFSLRNFAALPPVFEELARVLRPGGRLGLLEVDRPRNALLRAGHGVYFERVVPVLGGLIARDRAAYRYLPASASYMPQQPELAAMLREAGFVELRKRRHMGGAIQAITGVRA